MNKHLKRLPAYIIIGALLAFLIVWCVSLIKVESLTSKYYTDFEDAHLESTMIGDIEYFKVLECDGETARVYYVAKDETDGNVVSFKKQDGEWVKTSWETVWSKSGSASEAVWPYWYQVLITGV